MLLQQSEKLLNQELDAKTSKELTDEIWNFISAKKISDLQHYADKDDIKKILAVTKAEWNHIKASPLLLQIIESHIDIILTRYKGKKINELLSLYKIQKSDITDNLVSLLGNYISMPGGFGSTSRRTGATSGRGPPTITPGRRSTTRCTGSI